MSVPGLVPYVFAISAIESRTTSTLLRVVSINNKRRRVPSFTNTRPSRSSNALVTAPSGSVEIAVAVEIRRIGGPLTFAVSDRIGAGPCAEATAAAQINAAAP
jgi:hypothetical protein